MKQRGEDAGEWEWARVVWRIIGLDGHFLLFTVIFRRSPGYMCYIRPPAYCSKGDASDHCWHQ
jgi:hypothetical protein